MLKDFKQSILISIWFVFLTFPLMAVRVNTTEQMVEWRWMTILWVAIGSFVLSYAWRYFLAKKQLKKKDDEEGGKHSKLQLLMEDMNFRYKAMGVLLVLALVFPLVFDTYQNTIMISALIYVVLGLGLNISVGLAGLLDLGYVAFFAVGAYSYALLNYHFDLGFWTILPVGGILGCLFGVVLGFPILRLRGDYLAIVTLGFGMIIKVVLENWSSFSFGPSGIANIDKPGLFGMDMNIDSSTIYIYYIMIALVVFTILITNRLKNSRIGRAWIALREDEIACVAMGIDMARTKLSAYALGAFWAGMVGVLFAAKTTFINPASFTFMESAIILSIVVLGGMGSILGVILGAFILILLPEYLRAFSEYRMLAFGAAMVLMMIFRPQGIISGIRTKYEYKELKEETDNG
ncbi:branched-chain amino acid transport system permease protein [Malonomonas rubra DSM 5091]|uniref:Branched-chain amino acid transport system permease protein n=1 Tax=Malonomonas rubra DSM 5091 TaxID=1122189 RepID=A0A1M6C405_MALRU|nr:branched-chain amino acid ABC transporter permease [Malonomonas rubra]SHI55747.1 branched-chain amino acid transport system permease protein [Malonomonas rubra DSM 5091]